ncbi:MAG: hypothetical protein SGJ21_05625 [Alphaproteobacteria bacterium]|nr:hypothetical protein [Alphaproteobacteria bacterium]
MLRRVAASAVFVAYATAAGCASPPKLESHEIADACVMLKDNRSWYKALRASAKDWGAPIGLQLAIIKQESSFDAKARPDRGERKLFGLLQGDRPSSAYGYSQALETTWEEYKRETGNGGADRHSFRDSVDFIGWYVNATGKRTGVHQYNYKAHYLAYHEGQGGYLNGSYRNKAWLVETANRVQTQATRYESQVAGCKALKPKFLGIF